MGENFENLLQQALARDPELDSALAFLREHGVTIIDSIKAVRSVCRVPLGEAKQRVADSPTWEDVRDSHEQLVESIIQSLENDL
jgi:ribosomal protein L7/L12